MKIEKLNELIAKTEEKINKKNTTIEKKQNKIAKLQKKVTIEKTYEELTYLPTEERTDEINEQMEILSNIEDLKDDIERAENDVIDLKRKLNDYKVQRAQESAREAEVPEVLKQLMEIIITENDKADLEYQNKLKVEYKELVLILVTR